MDFQAFRFFGFRPHGVIEVVLGQDEFFFPTVLPSAVNVVSLGEFLASGSSVAGMDEWRTCDAGSD